MKNINSVKMTITGIIAAVLMAFSFVGCGTANTQSSAPAAGNSAAEAVTTTAAPENSAETVIVTTAAVTTEALTQAAETAPAAQTAQAVQVTTAAAPVTTEAVQVAADKYAGSYHEEYAGRGIMNITNNGDETYTVSVSWASNAAEKCCWWFTGSFNESGVLHYLDGHLSIEAFDENGNYTVDSNGLQTPYTVYIAGSGDLTFDGTGFIWSDDMGDVEPGTRFVAD